MDSVKKKRTDLEITISTQVAVQKVLSAVGFHLHVGLPLLVAEVLSQLLLHQVQQGSHLGGVLASTAAGGEISALMTVCTLGAVQTFNTYLSKSTSWCETYPAPGKSTPVTYLGLIIFTTQLRQCRRP